MKRIPYVIFTLIILSTLVLAGCVRHASKAPAGTATPGGVAGHGGTWYTYEWTLEIRPNPPFETIWVPFPVSSNIEEVHVATICVPEPASLGLLACGCATAVLRRRRR